METKKHLIEILACFNHWLSARNVRLIDENVLFIRDDAVSHEANKSLVQREDWTAGRAGFMRTQFPLGKTRMAKAGF